MIKTYEFCFIWVYVETNAPCCLFQVMQQRVRLNECVWPLFLFFLVASILNYRQLRAILNKSWRQHLTKQPLYSHLPLITKTIQIRRTRHTGHRWRSRDGLISDVLLWSLSHGRAKAGRPARTYIQQLSANTGCSREDQPEAVDNREGWQERVRDMCADGTTWWWWDCIKWSLNLFYFYITSN